MSRFFVVLSVFLPAIALADASLHFSNNADEKSSVETAAGKVRVQQAANDAVFMLFDQATETLTVVDNTEKTYQLITPARIEQTAKRIAAAKANLRANFENLSPEQQARLQPVVERMALAEAREHDIQAAGKDKVAGVGCTEHDVLQNGKPSQKLCTATAKQLNISATDYRSIADMLDMLAELSNKMGGGMMPLAISPKETLGIPVRTVEKGGEKVTSLQSVSNRSIDETRFSVPAGYTETIAP